MQAKTRVDAFPRDKTWFGQPRGLTILFLTEMWEKFSYFGMRVLLIYYMTKQLLLPQAQASIVYGLYTAFAYLTPIVGGLISDRWLGRRRAVIIGGAVMALGHFMMASESLFYPALVTIALGNGLFLPSLPSQIGSLYAAEDPRRGGAYNVYYVGINLGALLAPLLCGTVGEIFGWHWGFTLAGVGMLSGLLIYLSGGRYLPPEPERAAPVAIDKRDASAPGIGQSVLLMLAIGLAVVVVRGAYEQIGNTIALWADSKVDRTLATGLVIPMTWFQALNPLLIFALTPLLLRRWAALARQGREPAAVRKMAYGAAGIGAAYLTLALAAALAQHDGHKASWLWLTAFVVILTTAELYILPIGLGLFARLAPSTLVATAVAAWFLATFAGNLLAGALGTLWSVISNAQFFVLMAALAGSAALALLGLERPMRRVEASNPVTTARPPPFKSSPGAAS